MAFFKFRKPGDEPSAAPAQPESVEAMRRRAKYRLIGAAVLVLIGVIGFPLMFDQQPRPIAVDMPIEIPDRNKIAALDIPASAAVQEDKPAALVEKSVPTAAPVNAMPAAPKAPLEKEEILVSPPVEAPKPLKPPKTPEPVAKPEVIVKPVAVPLPVPKSVTDANDAAKAQALLDGRDPAKPPTAIEGRFVVQVGAFADAVRAREVRLKVERAGLKTYTHVAETKDGRRIRVRVGPFSTKAEADRVAEKIRRIDLPAAILTL